MLRYPQLPHQPPISRTLQYKKITKPLLERKRRARINRCLEQLKDLMVGALEAEGENINKLEKADILELTVRHLHRITKPHNPTEEVQRFHAGFTQCASEACGFLLSLPGLDARVGKRLVEHLGKRISQSLDTNPSTLSPNDTSDQSCPPNIHHDATRTSSTQRVCSNLITDHSQAEIIDCASLPRPIPTSSSSNVQNINLHQYRHFDSDYSPNIHRESWTSRKPDVYPEISISTLPASSCDPPNFQMSSRKLYSAESTKPLLLQVPLLTPSSSLPASPATSMSSIGEIDNRLDTLAMSPSSQSAETSSCQGEENMWRPW